MPEINRYFRQQTIPGERGGVPVNPQMASLPYEAEEKLGKSLIATGTEGMRYAIAEQRAERALQAVKLEQDLNNEVDKIAESYAMRSDHANFDKDVEGNINSLRQKYVDPIKDQVLKRAAEVAFAKQSYLLQKTVRDKKRVLMTEEATNRLGIDYNNAIKEYNLTDNQQEKEIIKNNLMLKGFELEKSHLLHLGTTEKIMQKFDTHAEEAYVKGLMNNDPARIASELRNPKMFPNLDPEKREELIYRADERAYREDIRKDRELNLARKEIHDTNGKEAFDRYLLWKEGKKAQDGVSFENWLEENRAADNISESTYQQHINRIERAKDRAVAAADKWTIAKRIQFGQIKQKFLDPESNYSWSDIPGLVKGMPSSAADELADILVTKPSKERREMLRVTESFITKKLKEAEASPETWESTMTIWKARIKDAPIDKLQTIANEITGDLPKGGLEALLKDLREKKGIKQQENKPKIGPKQTEAAIPQKGYRYSPVTGNFEEIK